MVFNDREHTAGQPRDARWALSRAGVLALVAAAAALGGIAWPWWWVIALPASAGCVIAELAGRSGRRDRARARRTGLDELAAAARESGAIAEPSEPRGRPEDELGRLGLGIMGLRALALERDNLREVMNAVGDPLLVTDEHGAVRLWNAAAEAFLSRGGERIQGRSIEELFTSAELVALHTAASRGTARQGIVRLAREGGVRCFEALASSVRWRRMPSGSAEEPGRSGAEGNGGGAGPGMGHGAVLTLRDVTELATASQLKTDFVANASHELRTPLSSIRGAVETLMDEPEDPKMRARLMGMIAGNVGRLEELTRDLLDLTRLETPGAGPSISVARMSEVAVSLSAFFEESCERRGVGLAFECAPELEEIRTDPRLLDLILRNLIENAIKFAYEKTVVRVRGEVIAGGPADALAGARLRVVDQGQGIPLAAQARIFERFYQVDQSRSGHTERRGTGLGLAIVKHAVKTLGGTIAVESVWKQGTTMTVELPACVEAAGGVTGPVAGGSA